MVGLSGSTGDELIDLDDWQIMHVAMKRELQIGQVHRDILVSGLNFDISLVLPLFGRNIPRLPSARHLVHAVCVPAFLTCHHPALACAFAFSTLHHPLFCTGMKLNPRVPVLFLVHGLAPTLLPGHWKEGSIHHIAFPGPYSCDLHGKEPRQDERFRLVPPLDIVLPDALHEDKSILKSFH